MTDTLAVDEHTEIFMTQLKTIYYLPGANGSLVTGLGEGLISRGLKVIGRATIGHFRQLSFQEQIDVIAEDIQSVMWTTDSLVVCNSYGAYLFLHAQAQLPPYVGNVLILSPILGAFESNERRQHFVPPRADRLMKLAREGTYPAPLSAEFHVGSEDWQSPPTIVEEFGVRLNCPVNLASGRGHMLGKDYVGPVLDRWLIQTSTTKLEVK